VIAVLKRRKKSLKVPMKRSKRERRKRRMSQ
jgi:hypothetical protein